MSQLTSRAICFLLMHHEHGRGCVCACACVHPIMNVVSKMHNGIHWVHWIGHIIHSLKILTALKKMASSLFSALFMEWLASFGS